MSLLYGLAAAAAVLCWTRHHWRGPWPWRIVELELDAHATRAPTDASRSDRPGAGGERRVLLGAPVVRPARTRPFRERLGSARRAGARKAGRQLDCDLPATIDLLGLALSAGHSLHTAVVDVAAAGTGPVAAAFRAAVEGFERGGRLTDELARLPDRFGVALRPLVTTIVVAASSGAPLGPSLQRLADTERRRLRRHAEERVRRLPVLLLLPLVGLVLPAFVAITVVPVALTTAHSSLLDAAAAAAPTAAAAPIEAGEPIADFPFRPPTTWSSPCSDCPI